jgi:hypothetical protein
MWYLDKDFLLDNNIEVVFMGTGITYYQQTIDDYKLFLKHGNEGCLFYVGKSIFDKFSNKSNVLKLFGIKVGDKTCSISDLKRNLRKKKINKIFNNI